MPKRKAKTKPKLPATAEGFKARLKIICQQCQDKALKEVKRVEDPWENGVEEDLYGLVATETRHLRAARLQMRFEAVRIAMKCGTLKALHKMVRQQYNKNHKRFGGHGCRARVFICGTLLAISYAVTHNKPFRMPYNTTNGIRNGLEDLIPGWLNEHYETVMFIER